MCLWTWSFLLLSLGLAEAQVGYDIYSEEDLLALDSVQSVSQVTVLPPEGFLGQRQMDKQSFSKGVGIALPVQQVVETNDISSDTYTNNINGDGSYSFRYSTNGGMSRQESGSDTGSGYRVEGSYSYIAPDGVTYTVHYIADGRGYRPTISKQSSSKVARARKPRKRVPRLIQRRKVAAEKTKVTQRPKTKRRVRRVRYKPFWQ